MQILINQQFGSIGINKVLGELKIKKVNPPLSLQLIKPKLELHTQFPKVTINQQDCFNDTGLKDFLTLLRDDVREAEQDALAGIARRASEGDKLARIEQGIGVISEISTEQMKMYDIKDFNIKSIPSRPPEIYVAPGEVDVELKFGQVLNNTMPGQIKTDYRPGSLDIYLEKRPYLNISWTGSTIDTLV